MLTVSYHRIINCKHYAVSENENDGKGHRRGKRLLIQAYLHTNKMKNFQI